jgi:hypothetical protein
MSTKMDGVKISISNDAKEKKEKKKTPAKKVLPKKKTLSKPVLKNSAKTITKPVLNNKKKEKKSFLSMLISVVLSALIVGGVIYVWQQQSSENSLNKLSEDAREARMEFEQRLNNIKNKLTGTEKEKEELKTEYEQLKEKAELLKNAKLYFSDSEIALSFDYPAVFGEVKIAILEGATGTSFLGEFTENEKLVFGGISLDYESDATSSEINFMDNLGYYSERNKYYFLSAGDDKSKDYEIQPSKIIGLKDGEALLLDKKSFINQDEFSIAKGENYINIGENIGGLVNLKGDIYKGAGFINSDFGMMPLADFEEMLKSVEFK